MWPFKNKHKRCEFCGWIVGHTPECRKYQNCNHEWARFYDVYSGKEVQKIVVYICRKCLSIRVFDRTDTKAKYMLKGRII